MEKFFKTVGVGMIPGTGEFASKFAIVYAAAKMAAELKLAPWEPKHPFKCVDRGSSACTCAYCDARRKRLSSLFVRSCWRPFCCPFV